jgi:hypothetical protein
MQPSRQGAPDQGRLIDRHLPGLFEYDHRRAWATVRIASGLWLISLCAFVCARGNWLGALLLVPAGILLWAADRLLQSAKRGLSHSEGVFHASTSPLEGR